MNWLLEPCESDNWPFAVRGFHPSGATVIGYGDTERDAYQHAAQGACEVNLGIIQAGVTALDKQWAEIFRVPREWSEVRALLREHGRAWEAISADSEHIADPLMQVRG